MTLLELCLKEIVTLLQTNYWPIGVHGFDELNPFVALPSDLNEKLVSAVVHDAHSGMLSVNELYPMLMSGRIKNFKLEYIIITHEEFICILTTLSIQGFYLTSLILDKIQFLLPKCVDLNRHEQPVACAIESLLYLSPNLKKLRMGISFDLKALQNIGSLKELELNFVPKNGLYDIIPGIDGMCCIPNDTLTYLSIATKPPYVIPDDEVSFILQYCPELIHIENNIAGGLEFLHASELADGSLQKQYKLEKIVLGDMFSKTSAVASLSAVHIASITCPNLKSLDILVNDHKAIAAMRYFKNLQILLVQWEMVASPGDFRLGGQLVLDEIGTKLKKLILIDFSNINFEAINRTCPHLEFFKIEYHGTENSLIDTACFQNLEILQLECMNEEGATRMTLLQLLSSCKNLSCLSLENIPSLDDETLSQILKHNNLAKLTEAHFIKCSIGGSGLQELINSCESLKFLEFSSTDIEFEDAVDIVHIINPFIVMIDT